MPTTFLGIEARDLAEGPDHHVEGVRDHDHERVGAVLLGVEGDVLMIGRLMPTRSSRLWPGFRGHARGDDDDVGAGAVGPVAVPEMLASYPRMALFCAASASPNSEHFTFLRAVHQRAKS
jgi:hypothetical protein